MLSKPICLHLLRGLVFLSIAMVLAHVVRGTGSVIVDGFQSLGAVAGSSRAGELHWPMLGSFLGYDHVWGFHWIGWPWLRSLLVPVLPWSPGVDIGICCGLWAVTAMWISCLAEREGDRLSGMVTGLAALLAPGFVVAAQSYRPEIPTALALVAAMSVWSASSNGGRLLRFLVCVILPTLHPLGLVVPGSWCLFDLLRGWRSSNSKRVLSAILKGVPLMIGAALMVAWLASHPEAWEQFRLNLKSQRMLIEGLGTGYSTFFRWGIGSMGALPLILLLCVASLRGAFLVVQSLRKPERSPVSEPLLLCGVGVISALCFNIVAKNPNVLHLVAILPLAAWLFVSQLNPVRRQLGSLAHQVASMVLLVFFSSLPLKQGWSLLRNSGAGHRASLDEALDLLPAARRILIPVAMWEAAATSPRKGTTEFRFSTFPNLLPKTERVAYEQILMNEMKPGDLLVWDPLQDEGGIFNFITVTALRHQLLRPADQGDAWERLPDLSLQAVYSKSRPAVFEVYRKR